MERSNCERERAYQCYIESRKVYNKEWIITYDPRQGDKTTEQKYREIEQLNSKSNMMSKEIYEKFIKYYPVQ